MDPPAAPTEEESQEPPPVVIPVIATKSEPEAIPEEYQPDIPEEEEDSKTEVAQQIQDLQAGRQSEADSKRLHMPSLCVQQQGVAQVPVPHGLPEGSTLMTDENGHQFVTVPQADGQVYAYPLDEFQKGNYAFDNSQQPFEGTQKTQLRVQHSTPHTTPSRLELNSFSLGAGGAGLFS